MITVLLTGGTSFIGRHLAKHLAQAGLRVIATYRSANRELIEGLMSYSPTLELVQLDISDEIGFDRLPSSIDAVVHIAGVSPMPEVSIDDMLAVNVTGTRNVQRYAARAGARKFIYSSSVSIHGRIDAAAVDEHTPINDPEPYGATKYLGERILASFDDTIPTVAIRLPGVLGPGAHRAWIPTLVDRLVAGEDVSIYSPDAAFNNAVHVSDLSGFIIQLLLRQNWQRFSAFPIGAAGKMTILEVVQLLRVKLGSTSTLCDRHVIKPSFLIDSTSAVDCFGYVPTRIDVMLMRYLEDLL
jgi:nucleoside-diphosphate-sugar epimerase